MANGVQRVPNYGPGRQIGRKTDLDYTLANFSSRWWRLNNLYFVMGKDNKPVRFRMWPEQEQYYKGMHTRNLILKARQRGFTTFVLILMLDAAMFEGAKCALIAHTGPDAKRLFREKVKFAYDKLPHVLKAANPLTYNSVSELVFKRGGSINVSNSFRGGTLKYLHISEFGKICAKYPDKAQEIITGALEAVSKESFATIESTAEGRSGYFFEFCQDGRRAMETGRTLAAMDWKFFFFSWYEAEEYQSSPEDTAATVVPDRLSRYFDTLEKKLGITISPARRAWYTSKEKTLGDDMKREYPSTPDEAFAQTVIGAYYANQFAFLYKNDRFIEHGNMPKNDGPVNTYWDIGVGDDTSIWFIRKVGNEYHVLDHYANSGEGLRHYMTVIKRKAEENNWRYGEHWAPHDIDNREFGSDAKSRHETAAEGYVIDGSRYQIHFKRVPRASVDDGIEAAREILPHCWFDADRCGLNDPGKEGVGERRGALVNLESYRKAWDDRNGCWRDRPLHDASSHDADAFRYFAVANTKLSRTAKKTSLKGIPR